jgi:GntR family transcriptional regulator, transcriptional repressor for pyruvate dehydrogenase complex
MDTKMPIQSHTLSSQIKHYVLDMISQQQLTPGMAVPSEVKLIEELGVSRGVIREAYRSLSALGILEIKSGKVPRVKASTAACLSLFLALL